MEESIYHSMNASTLEKTKPPALLAYLKSWLDVSRTETALAAICRTLFKYMSSSSSSNEHIQHVIDTGAGQRLVQLLSHQSPLVVGTAIQTCAVISAGDDSQTQYLIDLGVIPLLMSLLSHNNSEIVKSACWIVSNITSGTREQAQAVFDGGLISSLVYVLEDHTSIEVKREAAFTLTHLISAGTEDFQIMYLLHKHDFMKALCDTLCDILVCRNSKILTKCIEGLELLLEVGEQVKNYKGYDFNYSARLIGETNGFKKIETMYRDHMNTVIFEKSVNILERFYWKTLQAVEPINKRYHSACSEIGISFIVGDIEVPYGTTTALRRKLSTLSIDG